MIPGREIGRVIASTTLAVLGLFAAMNADGVIHPSGDSEWYLNAARDPFTFQTAPFSYRFLAPLIVGHLPFATPERGFAALTVVSLIATGVLLYVFVRETLGSVEAARWGLVLFLLSGSTLQSLYYPVLVDPFCFVFIQAALTLAVLGRWPGAAIAMAVGVLAKEHAIFAIPTLLVLSRVGARRAPWWGTAAVVGVPAVCYAVIHYTPLLFGTVVPSFGYFSLDNVRTVLAWDSQWGSLPKVAISCLLVAFNLLWLTAALGFARARPEARATALLPLCLLPTFFIATDWARMLLFGFPALVVLTASLPLKGVARYVLPVASGAVSVWVQFAAPSAMKQVVTAALLLVGAAAVAASLWRSSGGDPELAAGSAAA